jgi:hypothetical protein
MTFSSEMMYVWNRSGDECRPHMTQEREPDCPQMTQFTQLKTHTRMSIRIRIHGILRIQ